MGSWTGRQCSEGTAWGGGSGQGPWPRAGWDGMSSRGQWATFTFGLLGRGLICPGCQEKFSSSSMEQAEVSRSRQVGRLLREYKERKGLRSPFSWDEEVTSGQSRPCPQLRFPARVSTRVLIVLQHGLRVTPMTAGCGGAGAAGKGQAAPRAGRSLKERWEQSWPGTAGEGCELGLDRLSRVGIGQVSCQDTWALIGRHKVGGGWRSHGAHLAQKSSIFHWGLSRETPVAPISRPGRKYSLSCKGDSMPASLGAHHPDSPGLPCSQLEAGSPARGWIGQKAELVGKGELWALEGGSGGPFPGRPDRTSERRPGVSPLPPHPQPGLCTVCWGKIRG